MKTSMLAPVRTDAGLSSPPMRYTTNDTEAGNFMAKQHLHFDKCNPHVFVDKIWDLIESQKRNKMRALIGKGPFNIRESFKQHQPLKWAQMSINSAKTTLKGTTQQQSVMLIMINHVHLPQLFSRMLPPLPAICPYQQQIAESKRSYMQ